MEIQGLKKLVEQLRTRAAKVAGDKAEVTVGYTAQYAVYVHENLEAKHPSGQAKFLEQPARQLSNDGTLARIVNGVVAAGKTIGQGLLAAGLRLQRDSQLITPVDTGNLRASAFTRIE